MIRKLAPVDQGMRHLVCAVLIDTCLRMLTPLARRSLSTPCTSWFPRSDND
jgi:hypothetical protein